MTGYKNKLYFAARRGSSPTDPYYPYSNDVELWAFDGTTSTFSMAADVFPSCHDEVGMYGGTNCVANSANPVRAQLSVLCICARGKGTAPRTLRARMAMPRRCCARVRALSLCTSLAVHCSTHRSASHCA